MADAQRRAGLIAAVLGVLGCDDGTVITRVDRFTNVKSYLTPLALGGLPVEVHGAPFEGVTAAEVAARLRLPPSYPTDLSVRAATPADARAGRLVLAFNPATPGRFTGACAGDAGATRANRDEIGFSVTATLCNGERVVSTGHLEARKTRADDPEGFARAMSTLFQQMLLDG